MSDDEEGLELPAMSLGDEPVFKRKRGGQPGNQNARKEHTSRQQMLVHAEIERRRLDAELKHIARMQQALEFAEQLGAEDLPAAKVRAVMAKAFPDLEMFRAKSDPGEDEEPSGLENEYEYE